MEGGRGARRLAPSSSGCSWAAFEETAKDYGTSGREGGRTRVNIPAREIGFVGGVHKGDKVIVPHNQIFVRVYLCTPY